MACEGVIQKKLRHFPSGRKTKSVSDVGHDIPRQNTLANRKRVRQDFSGRTLHRSSKAASALKGQNYVSLGQGKRASRALPPP